MQVSIPVRVTSDLSPTLAYVMADSVRRHMPNAKLIHVAEPGATKLDGFDEVMHVAPEGDFVEQLFRVLAAIEGNVLSLDYDIIINADVSNVFDSDFDAVFTTRPPKDGTIKRSMQDTYNMGVVFSKNPVFWEALRDMYLTCEGRDGWLRSQTLASHLARALSGRFRVAELPGEIYNYTPMSESEDLTRRRIVHYKGSRKVWMLPPERRHEVVGNIEKMVQMVSGNGA
jgi:hypothetical protein